MRPWKDAELCTATATPNSYHDVLKKRCGLVAAGACAIFGKVFGLNLLLYNIYQIVRYVHVFWSAETNMCFHDLPRAAPPQLFQIQIQITRTHALRAHGRLASLKSQISNLSACSYISSLPHHIIERYPTATLYQPRDLLLCLDASRRDLLLVKF